MKQLKKLLQALIRGIRPKSKPQTVKLAPEVKTPVFNRVDGAIHVEHVSFADQTPHWVISLWVPALTVSSSLLFDQIMDYVYHPDRERRKSNTFIFLADAAAQLSPGLPGYVDYTKGGSFLGIGFDSDTGMIAIDLGPSDSVTRAAWTPAILQMLKRELVSQCGNVVTINISCLRGLTPVHM